MYRSSLLRSGQPFFNPKRIFFDTDAAFEVLSRSDFGFVHQVLSFCRADRPGSIAEASRDFRAIALDRMVLLKNHGATYLDAEEYRRCFEGAERFFYDGLAREWLARPLGYPDAAFWEFQNKGLATAGSAVRPARLARAVARAFAKSVASPLEFAKALRARS